MRSAIAFLTIVLNLLLVAAVAQQQGQSTASANSPQTEISTRDVDAPIKVQVNLVLVPVVVKDANGSPVSGLKKEDFKLFDNGKPQTVATFGVETAEAPTATSTAVEKKPVATETENAATGVPAPNAIKPIELPHRFIALVFDDSHMKVAESLAVHAATEKLFATLTPTDRVAIYSTNGDVQQDYTGDPATLRKTLANIVPHSSKDEGRHDCPDISYYQADLIVNKQDPVAILAATTDAQENQCFSYRTGAVGQFNAEASALRVLQEGDFQTEKTYQRLDDIVRKLAVMPGQRVLVYVSRGFLVDINMIPTGADWIEHAVRAGVVVNTIDARGLYTPEGMGDIDAPPVSQPPRENGQWQGHDYQGVEEMYRIQAQFDSGALLQGMAAGTGGTYFHNRNDLDVGLRQALAAPTVSYVLGFRPESTEANGKLHDLKVVVANGNKYSIQARNGYYAQKKSADPEEQAKQEVTDTLFSANEFTGIPVQMRIEFFKTDDTSAQLSVLTRLDTRGVKFRRVDGRSYDSVVLATGVFDANGQLVDGKVKEITLKLQDATLQKMTRTGITVKTVFNVKPGTYVVRSVVRGAEGEQLTSQNLTTEIPQ